MISKTTFFALAVGLGLSSTTLANRDFERTNNGFGQLRIEGRSNSRLDRLRVDLNRDRTFTITTYGSATRRLSGRYIDEGNGVIDLDVESGFGNDRTTGFGTLRLRGNGNFTSVTIDGRTNGNSYSLEFTSSNSGSGGSGGDWSGGGGWSGNDVTGTATLNKTERGSGRIERERANDERITEVKVILERNGSARITVRTDRGTREFRGRQLEYRSGRIPLLINEAFGDRSPRESRGWIIQREGGFSQIEFAGWADDRRFNVRFRTRGY